MAAEGMQFPWRWNGGPISVNLEVIWEMSVEILDDTENGIVRGAFVGQIQPTDCEVSAPTFEKIFETRKPLRLLLDWTRFSGWSQESESQAFFFRIRHRGDIERIAIVGESK